MWTPIDTLGLSLLLVQALLSERTALTSTDLDFTLPMPMERLPPCRIVHRCQSKAGFQSQPHLTAAPHRVVFAQSVTAWDGRHTHPLTIPWSPRRPLLQLCPHGLQQSLPCLCGLAGQENIYLKRHFTWGWDVLGLLPININ